MEDISSKPSNPSPRLPPETLFHICYYVKGPVDSPDSTLDLMSVALVNKDWNAVATPLFEGLLSRLSYTKPFSFARRLATLLLECRQYGLPFCDMFQTCEIIVDDYISEIFYEDSNKPRNPYSELFERAKIEDINTLFSLLKLTNPKHIKLVIGYPGGSIDRQHEREQFFNRLRENVTIGEIQKLELSFFKEWYQPKDQPTDYPLASLVRTMSRFITSIKVEHEPDAETISALSSLPELHMASIFFCPIPKADAILRCAPRLRILILESLSGVGADALFSGVASRAADLEDLTLASVPDISARTGLDRLEGLVGMQPIAQALEALIASAPRLAHLYLLDCPYVNNNVVRAAARNCRDIQHLCLPPAEGLDGVGIWSDQIRPWPNLQFIHTSERMAPEFVQPIIEECEELEEVAFGEVGDGGDDRVEMFERGGFYIYGSGWRREMGCPTGGGGEVGE